MESTVEKGIRIFSDAAALARGAASQVAQDAVEALVKASRCSIALSGGETPRLLFRLLGTEYGEAIAWERVHLFWADERMVPPEHTQSNFGMAREELTARIAIPPGNIHRIAGELSPVEAAVVYERELREYFGADVPRFDIILLGLGEDGHTASLFPGSAALAENDRLAVPVFSPAAGNWRVTLTLPVLNNARRILFLVSGAAKARIIGEILGQGRGADYPAGRVAPASRNLLWFLDEAAASGLSHPA